MEKRITLAMLSWRQPRTLRNTLESYQRNGLLDLVDEKIIFFNECVAQDERIAEKYGFKILKAKRNIGIALPFKALVEASTCEHFLFLENDFLLIEPLKTVKQELSAAIELIDSDIADCVRLRHRWHYGDPNYWLQKVWDGRADVTKPNLNSVYLYHHPEEHCDQIRSHSIDARNYYLAPASISNFTNNPCIYKTDFLKNLLSDLSFNEFDFLENKLDPIWDKSNFTVAQGEGLFKHHPLEVSGSGFSAHKRIKHAIKKPIHYILRIGYKRRVINIFVFQFLPMIFKININVMNKIMFNISLGRYESE